MFIGNKSKGFCMTFDNGFEISVQWGTMNYCSNKGQGGVNEHEITDKWKSPTAEIMISHATPNNNDNIDLGNGDKVAGWLSTDTVAKLIGVVSSVKNVDELNLYLKQIKL